MGHLESGVWREGRDARTVNGEFVRRDSQFRDRITADGSSGYPAEAGRYHLYVSAACPWAHRTIIFRKLKRLEDAISMSIVEPVIADQGWPLAAGADTVHGFHHLHQVYTKARPDYTGRVSVPVLWDRKRGTIVNNESSEIIRMLNSEFESSAGVHDDYYPQRLRADIDAVNKVVYENINNGVYRCGFATTQDAYERAFDALFAALDGMEARLDRSRYLVGDRITEADWRLFPTLVRFDAVYHGHFKCNLRRIEDYPSLSNYLRDLYQVPGVAETVDMDHIKRHYYASHRHINPTGVVPGGPALDFSAPHDRARKFARGRLIFAAPEKPKK
jgi:putative glutathione S-transferase